MRARKCIHFVDTVGFMPRGSKELCYEAMKLRILRTELEPGALLEEASLAAQYALSRTPLREVLQRLAGEGYVTLAEHRGAKVASMDIAVIRTFFQTAPMIYASISRLAAENRKLDQLVTLQTAQDAFAKSTRAGDATTAASLSPKKAAICEKSVAEAEDGSIGDNRRIAAIQK